MSADHVGKRDRTDTQAVNATATDGSFYRRGSALAQVDVVSKVLPVNGGPEAPAFLRGVSVKIDDESLASVFGNKPVLAPAWASTTAEITVKSDAHAQNLVGKPLLDCLRHAAPRLPALAPLTDPEAVSRLREQAVVMIETTRNWMILRGIDYRFQVATDMVLTELSRALIQDLLLEPSSVGALIAGTWSRPFAETSRGTDRILPVGILPNIRYPLPKRSELLGVTAARMTQPNEWLYDGATGRAVQVQVESEQSAKVAAKEAVVAAQVRAAEMTRTTPREARVLVTWRHTSDEEHVAEKAVLARRADPAFANSPSFQAGLTGAGPKTGSVRGGRFVQCYELPWPADCAVPAPVVREPNYSGGPPVVWTVMPSDEEVDLSTFDVELGRRRVAPAFILAGLGAAAIEAVAATTAVTNPVNSSDKTTCRNRVKLLRAYLNGPVASLFERGLVAHYVGFVQNYGCVRLELDSLIVAAEINLAASARAWESIDSLEAEGRAVAADPKRHMFKKLSEES